MSDWIEWNSGECPVADGTVVDIKMRNDEICRDIDSPEAWRWNHSGLNGDILAYRVVKEAQDNDWIEWNGGECPVADGTMIDVKLRSGSVHPRLNGPERLSWRNDLGSGTIIAYRVVKEAPNVPETHEKPFNRQIGGTHYKDMPIQPFEFSMKNGLDPMQHTILKYVTRFRHKNGREDLEKAKHTIDLLIEHEYGDGKQNECS